MTGPTVFTAARVLPLPQAATAYAAAGMAIFPCVPGAKRPLTEHGFTDATTDLEQVARWWRRWPGANIGLPTGGAGFDVLDVDVHPAGSGFPSLARARRAGLVETWSHVVRTPSGGVHLYFPADAEHTQASWSRPHDHVDFRGTGGYVVAPPSLVIGDGRRHGYTLIAMSTGPRPINAAVVRRLLAPAPSTRPATWRRGLAPAAGEHLAAWLAGQPEGNRNRALFWAACRQAETGVPLDQAGEHLGAAAARTGLSEREINATIASAYRTIIGHATATTAPAVTGRPGP